MKIYEEAEYLHQLYTETPVALYEGLEYNQRDIIKTADFYSLSRYLSGMKDDLGRDKQFYNVVNFRVTVAKTATEFDIKDFVASSDDSSQWVQTMLFNREAYKWMKETRFSKFLNKYAYVRPKYGGVLYKKIEKDGELKIEVCDWRNVETDQVDITGSPIIEKHYLTALQLNEKRDVWENVDEAIELLKDKQKNSDEAVGRLEVWEVTGVMHEDVFRAAKGQEERDDTNYSLQKHFMLSPDEENDMVFYSTKPKELGYRYLAWEEVAGRGLGRGVIEESEEGQVWINDSVIKQKNTMDIAGRVLIKTDSDTVANNILEVDDGKIFKLNKGEDMAAMQLAPAALGQFDGMIAQWNQQLDNAISTYEANTGEQTPANTPYSQTVFLNQQAQKPFAFRMEEAAIDLEEMFNEWVIPHIIKKIKNEHILAEDFDEATLEAIDESFANYKQRQVAKTAALDSMRQAVSGEIGAQIPDFSEQMEVAKEKTLANLEKQGNRRYIKIPSNFFDSFTGKMTLNITNEQKNKQVVLQSLSQILQTVSQSFNPQTGQFAILENPTLVKIFGSIVDASGIGLSPAELGIGRTGKRAQQPTPQMAEQPVTPVA